MVLSNVELDGGRARPLIVATILLSFTLPFILGEPTIYLLTLALLYSIAALGVVVPMGYAGELILCQGAFIGIGAYSYVKLSTFGLPTWSAVVFGTILTLATAAALSRAAIRAKGVYLAILTIAFNEIFIITLSLFPNALGGTAGLSAPDLELFWLDQFEATVYYWLVLVSLVVILYITTRILRTTTGWGFLSMRDDRVAAESIGINTERYRLLAFSFSGAVCGFSGALHAPVIGYISPSMFAVSKSVDIILAGVIGGLLYPVASIIGSITVIFLPEFLRVISEFRMVVFSITLIFVFIYLPDGLGGWIKDYLEK